MSLIKRLQIPTAFVWCRYCAVAAVPKNVQNLSSPVEHLDASQSEPSQTSNSNLTGAAMPTPHFDNTSEKTYSPKINGLVDKIANLTLLEVADLNELLKVKLGLPDVTMAAPMAVGSAPVSTDVGEEEGGGKEEKAAEKLVFNVKLVKFEAESKVKLIKEIKSLIEGMNLVQAKKFVEGVPQMIMSDVGKEQAEKIKEKVEAAGGVVEIE